MFANRRITQRSLLAVVVLSILSLLLMAGKPAAKFPEVIPIPNGFQPEGIATGRGATFYVGSIPTGAIYRGDLRTGQGAVLVPGQAGHQSLGLKYDGRTDLLYVAGGPTGAAFVYNASTGANVASIQLTDQASTFINDVIVTKRAAYFTDSFRPVLYRVDLERDGELPDPPESEEVPLSGDFVFTPGGFNTNGIAATPNGKSLIIVNTAAAALYRVDPESGQAKLIDLGGGSVPNGDGILLQGKTLYVVQNFLNQVAVVRLDSKLSAGTIVSTLTSPFLRIPTTIARFGDALYAVNARFDTPPTPDTEYEVVRLPR
jgi:sugar lactone lactonase YvrE